MRRSPQPLKRIIAGDATLAQWHAQCVREEAWTAAIRRQLPRQLGARVHVRETAERDLEILASAGAVAAAVRQRLPDLATALRRDGWDGNALRVRVQVALPAPEPPRGPRRALDAAAAAPLVRLARTLPEGPLRAAIARLARHGGRG